MDARPARAGRPSGGTGIRHVPGAGPAPSVAAARLPGPSPRGGPRP